MASKIKVDQIEGSTGSSITIPTGQTLTVTDGIASTSLTGTINDARLPTVPVSKGGTGLTSLGSAGQTIKVNSGASALEFSDASAGITSASLWRMTTSFSGSANPVASNWSEAQYITSDRVTQSSGIFTFPSTGFWRISTGWAWYRNNDDRQCTVSIQCTENNSSFQDRGAFDAFFQLTSNNNTHTSAYGNIIFDVTNTTTHKVRIKIDTVDGNTNNYAGSSSNRTYVEFIRLGDT